MRLVVACAGLSLATLVHASEARWQCALSSDLTRLHCVAVGPSAPPPTAQGAEAAPTRAGPGTNASAPTEVRGTRFPLDTRRPWTVDLFAPADDGAFVEQLARATICYRTPRCHVEVDLQPLSRRGDATGPQDR